MFDDANMRSGLYLFFHIALFGSFALCMSVWLFDSAHRSTSSSSLSVVSPECVVAVEVVNYNMRRFCFQMEGAGWLYQYTGWFNCNMLNIILFTDRNAVNLQTP